MATRKHRYRTEITIPTERFISLQLPEGLPAGKAMVVVESILPNRIPSSIAPGDESDLDRQDIEWWDDFDDRADSPAPATCVETNAIPHSVRSFA